MPAEDGRPSCPDCGSPPFEKNGRYNIISNGNMYWRCNVCGNQWVKKRIGRREPDWSARPDCPFCGHEKVVSHDPYWICRRCGRYFQKDGRWQVEKLTLPTAATIA